ATNQCVFRAGCNSPPAVCDVANSRSRARERPCEQEVFSRGVSRSGVMPGPTVIVRMEEDVQIVMSVTRVPAAQCARWPEPVAVDENRWRERAVLPVCHALERFSPNLLRERFTHVQRFFQLALRGHGLCRPGPTCL